MFSASEPILSWSNVKVHYPNVDDPAQTQVVRAVDDVTLSLFRGETLALVGESGSGKSSLAFTAMGLSHLTKGKIVFDGMQLTSETPEPTLAYRKKIQAVFQDPFSTLHPRKTIRRVVREGPDIHRSPESRLARDQKVDELLTLVGLPLDIAERTPGQLSGGQRQRVGIARALALEPSVLVADEAVSALDVSVQAQILNLLRRIKRERQQTMLFISHDLSVVRHVGDRVAVMYLGRIVELAETQDLFVRPAHPYTQILLAADLNLPPRADRRAVKSDSSNEPKSIGAPAGCRFAARCPLRHVLDYPGACTNVRPDLAGLDGHTGHQVACHFPRAAAEFGAGKVPSTNRPIETATC